MMWVDQTLQEGLSKGISKDNLIHLMQMLQNLPVGVIDSKVVDWEKCGLPRLNQILKKLIRGRINGTIEEVELAYKLGFQNIMIACTPHLGQSLISQINTALFAAQKRGMSIGICIQNASQFSIDKIEFLWRDIPFGGIHTFIYGDTDSLLDPLAASRILALLRDKIPITLEFHGHNAYGLATGNALAAYQVGVEHIAVSVGGLGLQGHAALEELIMARKRLLGEGIADTSQLTLICSQILSTLGLTVPKTKAIIGQDIFAHESGIHVDGVVKNPILYEVFSPEEVGLARKLVIGKHSGTASIQAKFCHRNIKLSTEEAGFLLKSVRKLAVEQKRQIDDHVLWNLYQTMLSEPGAQICPSEVKHQRFITGT